MTKQKLDNNLSYSLNVKIMYVSSDRGRGASSKNQSKQDAYTDLEKIQRPDLDSKHALSL